MNANPLSAGRPEYNFYTMEVVQRIGYDSFTPDIGVLISRNKNGRPNDGSVGRGRTNGPAAIPVVPGGSAQGGRGRGAGGGGGGGGGRGGSCGASYNCFTWVIDAHPEDIKKVDYIRPDGEVAMRTVADYRQLNDALFHAGLDSGSQYEWQDPHNRLHFYVVDVHRERGVLSYAVGVKSLDGAGPQQRGVAIEPAAAQRVRGSRGTCTFTVRNTGTGAATAPALHPEDANRYLNQDIYRLSVTASGTGWSAQLGNALVAIPFGGAQQLAVHVGRSAAAAAAGSITLRAASEGDTSKASTAECAVDR